MKKKNRVPLPLLLALVLGLLFLICADTFAQEDRSTARQAIAILQQKCVACHGEAAPSGLDMRQRATILKGGGRGLAVVLGKSDHSLLYLAASHQGELQMPPGSNAPLTAGELAILKRWIDEGLDWPVDATFQMIHGSSPTAEQATSLLAGKATLILEKNCGMCHGSSQMSGLDMRGREGLLTGGKRGPAVIPGNAEQSLLYLAASRRGKLIMPPANRAGLQPEELETLRQWINEKLPWPRDAVSQGISYASHWAFQPVRKVTPPDDPTGWSKTPIDRFIMAKLHEHALAPVAAADKRVLLRRAYFDLTGLPPTPPDISRFLADRSPDAYETLIDRLLASPRYGERWGRHWMDVVRYADTGGDNADYPIPEARFYRDYIIDSFNADKPYDQFVLEQLAGDILAKQGPPQKYAERVTATGFLAISRRYATGPYELWHLTLEDTLETLGEGIMALTLRCARCHDHKFDPITTKDYYAMYGIFASTRFPYGGSEEFSGDKNRLHFVPLLPPEKAEPRLRAWQRDIASLQAELDAIAKTHPLAKTVAELEQQIERKTEQLHEPKPPQGIESVKEELAALTKKREAAESDLAQKDPSGAQLPPKVRALRRELRSLRKPGLPPDLPGAYGVQEGESADVCVQLQGDPEKKGPMVHRNVPVFLTSGPPIDIPPDSSGRLQLARWLIRPDNPLTARVMVNRIWQYHFGKGIVDTPSNFGMRGDLPSHPELLDWLAAQFVESGWSIKAMHRLIMLSSTYQLSARSEEANNAKDAPNQWYWRFNRQRLDAEEIRDAMLAVSDRLDLTRAGPHPFPPIDEWHWTQHEKFEAVYPTNHRSVYIMTQRLVRHPYLALFDGADPNYTTGTRTSSIVPMQALYMMNNPFVQEQSMALAKRLIGGSPVARRRMEMGCELTWGRRPTPSEAKMFGDYIERYKLQLRKTGTPAGQLEQGAWAAYARILLSSDEFIYLD